MGVVGGEKERREVEFGWEEREKPKEEGGFSLRVGERGERETCGGLWCCHAGGGGVAHPCAATWRKGKGREGRKERRREFAPVSDSDVRFDPSFVPSIDRIGIR